MNTEPKDTEPKNSEPKNTEPKNTEPKNTEHTGLIIKICFGFMVYCFGDIFRRHFEKNRNLVDKDFCKIILKLSICLFVKKKQKELEMRFVFDQKEEKI